MEGHLGFGQGPLLSWGCCGFLTACIVQSGNFGVYVSILEPCVAELDHQNPFQGGGRLILCCYNPPRNVQPCDRSTSRQTERILRIYGDGLISRGGRSFFAAAKTAGLTFGMARRTRSPLALLSALRLSFLPLFEHAVRVLTAGTLLFGDPNIQHRNPKGAR